MSMNLKDDILNAVQNSTPPPPPTSGSNAVKPPNVGYSVQAPKKPCFYETPCGWCTKWDKKCDKRIGCDESDKNLIKNYLMPEVQMFTNWYLAKLRGEKVDDVIKIIFEGETK